MCISMILSFSVLKYETYRHTLIKLDLVSMYNFNNHQVGFTVRIRRDHVNT